MSGHLPGAFARKLGARQDLLVLVVACQDVPVHFFHGAEDPVVRALDKLRLKCTEIIELPSLHLNNKC